MDLLAFILAISAEGITDEQVQTALNAYIAEHPEAVTTVTDGSITKAKLDSNLQATVDDVGVLKSAIDYPEEITFEYTSGHYIKTNTTINVSDPYATGSYTGKTTFMACSPGDEFTISAKSGSVNTYSPWFFCDGNGNILLKSNIGQCDGVVVTAPIGSAYIGITTDRQSDHCYKGVMPSKRIDILEEKTAETASNIETLGQDVETLGQDVDSIQNKLDGSPVDYTTGAISDKYCALVSGSTTEIEIKNGSGFSYSKIDVQDWMYEVDFNILSSTGIAASAIYCGFADENNLLISKNTGVSVGQYKLSVPSNAKFIYLNFFGSAYCEGYTIKSDPFAKNSQIEQLQDEITNPFDGLTGVAFGTSLTYKAQTTGGYLQYLQELSGITFDNQGIGSSVILGDGGNLDMLAAIKAYTGYTGKRVCILEGFVNDWYTSKTLGTYTDAEETTVCGCVRSALNYMLSQNANMTIFLILDHYGRNYGGADCSSFALRGGKTQYAYYEEIAKAAESLGIPVIKEYAGCQISENTPQYLLDNIHPNVLGAKQSANYIWSMMKMRMPNEIS